MSDGQSLAALPKGWLAVSPEQANEQQNELARMRRRVFDAEHELSLAKEKQRLIGERVQQLEAILASHFARSVKLLSGSRKQFGESLEAASAVSALEDHLKALRLLNNNGVECDKVEVGVRLLLDQRDRVVDMSTERPPMNIVEVTVQPEVYEIAGTYSLTRGDGPDSVELVPKLPSKP